MSHDSGHEDPILEDASTGTGFNDFMGEIEDSMRNMMKESSAASPKTVMEHWQAFSSAINWTETWLQMLLGFHAIMLLLIIIFRNNEIVQAILFLLMAGLVYFSERINTYCAAHWNEFATQNYFDEHGSFAGLLFSGPFLVLLFLQLVTN